MLIVNLERVFVLTRLHEGVGKSGDRGEIVVDAEKFAGERSGIGEAPIFQVSLE